MPETAIIIDLHSLKGENMNRALFINDTSLLIEIGKFLEENINYIMVQSIGQTPKTNRNRPGYISFGGSRIETLKTKINQHFSFIILWTILFISFFRILTFKIVYLCVLPKTENDNRTELKIQHLSAYPRLILWTI